MTALAIDAFTRADSADLGTNWTPHPSYNQWAIVSNHAEPQSSGSDAVEYYNAITWPDDQYAQAEITTAGTGDELGVGPALRINTSTDNLYWCVAEADQVTVASVAGGSYSQIAAISQTWTNGHVLRFEAEGSTLRVFDNGTQIDTGITNGAHSSGSAGVAYSAFTATRQLDNWEAGDLSGINITNLTNGQTTSSGTTADTASVSPVADALILLTVSAYDSDSQMSGISPTISGGGMTTWELVDRSDYDTTGGDSSSTWVFRAQQASPGSGAITIDWSTTISRFEWSVDQFEGVAVGNNGADAIVQSVSAVNGTSGATSITVSLSAFSDPGNISFGAFGVQADPTMTWTPGTNFIKLGEIVDNSSNQHMTAYRSGDNDPNASWSSTGTIFRSGAVGLEIAATTTTLPEKQTSYYRGTRVVSRR